MSEISKGAMAAVTILQELENVGISTTLRYEPNGRSGEARWHVHGTFQKIHHLAFAFAEGQVIAEGDWVQFAARAVGQMRDRLRHMASAGGPKR